MDDRRDSREGRGTSSWLSLSSFSFRSGRSSWRSSLGSEDCSDLRSSFADEEAEVRMSWAYNDRAERDLSLAEDGVEGNCRDVLAVRVSSVSSSTDQESPQPLPARNPEPCLTSLTNASCRQSIYSGTESTESTVDTARPTSLSMRPTSLSMTESNVDTGRFSHFSSSKEVVCGSGDAMYEDGQVEGTGDTKDKDLVETMWTSEMENEPRSPTGFPSSSPRHYGALRFGPMSGQGLRLGTVSRAVLGAASEGGAIFTPAPPPPKPSAA
mmetsp:Transcript_121624/g.259615  ORF Transcript_121624/g.259615 Transcript_121624/m.259615 type:complete len:268 (+) Transcript_121624:2-805(+)